MWYNVAHTVNDTVSESNILCWQGFALFWKKKEGVSSINKNDCVKKFDKIDNRSSWMNAMESQTPKNKQMNKTAMHIFIAMNPVTRYWWRTETKNCCPAREITSHFEQLQIYIYIYIHIVSVISSRKFYNIFNWTPPHWLHMACCLLASHSPPHHQRNASGEKPKKKALKKKTPGKKQKTWKNNKKKKQKSWGWGRVSQESQNIGVFCFFVFPFFFLVFSMGPSPKTLQFFFCVSNRFLVSPWGPPQRLFKYFFVFSNFFLRFLHGAPPQRLFKYLFFCVFFFQCLFWFSPWCPPQRISKYVFLFFQPKGLPKGQMVAMTMNVLKRRPKFGLCVWNIQFNVHIIVIIFLIYILLIFPLYLHSFWHMYILAYLNIRIAISLNGPWGRSISGRWRYIYIHTYNNNYYLLIIVIIGYIIIIHIYIYKKTICTWCISYGDSPLNLCLGPHQGTWRVGGSFFCQQMADPWTTEGLPAVKNGQLQELKWLLSWLCSDQLVEKDLEFCSEWTGKALKPGLACCNFSLNGLLRSHNLFYQ